MITVQLNGRPHKTRSGSLAELASEISPAPQTLLFEWNHQAISKAQWESTRLSEGDTIEVLKISAGG